LNKSFVNISNSFIFEIYFHQTNPLPIRNCHFKEFDFKNEKERLILTIKNLEHQNAELVKDNDKTNKQCSDYYRRIITLESNEEDYEAEIKELRSFECHIKGLLTEAA